MSRASSGGAISFRMSPSQHLENWPWPLKINTLGQFAMERDGEAVRFSGKVQQKPLLLLKALIAFGGREVKEEQLCDALWPDAEGDLAHRSFETTLYRLRLLLGKEAIAVQGREAHPGSAILLGGCLRPGAGS